MKSAHAILTILLLSAALFFLAGICAAQEEDAEGCKDYPMFSRMKGFYLTNCESNYDQAEFYIAENSSKTVEGQKTKISYNLKEGVNRPSNFQIIKNYANAVKSLGGSVLYESEGYSSFKLIKNGKEYWVSVNTYNGATGYDLQVLEVGEMAQEVTASDMLTALNKDGYMALYINFETGQAAIRPESQPILEQMVALLNDNPDLNLSIEGHTDNVGSAASNKTLSEQRAKAVMAAIVTKGIKAGRLSAVGWGQDKPVADNRSEEGRAKNRRVEIVKK